MKITNVTVEHYDRGIPLKGWGSVKSALEMYARGITRGSDAAENEQVKAIGESFGPFGLGLYIISAPHRQGVRNSFVECMTDEAHQALRVRDRWSRSYDYDGPGVFFKNVVRIMVLDRKEELYMLEISAAYVGSVPEDGLAEKLGIPQALRSYTITAQIKSEDGLHFAFDFEKILRALDRVLKTDSLRGEEIANKIMIDGSETPQIYFGDEISVTVTPGRVKNRFDYDKPGEAQDTWTVRGAVLHGLLDSSYEDKSKKEPPTIILSVFSAKNDSFGHSQPVWEADLKEKIFIMSNQIAGELKKN